MFIKEIELDNFRIYKGYNRVELLPDGDRNIIVISGKNGFGKTTFLMSLVWCLYGHQMGKVDELYKKEIKDKGNYGKYIGNSLNRLAEADGKTRFSVSVTFTEVKIPDITCNEVTIKRSFDTKTSTKDELTILIDGQQNQVIQDLSQDNQDGGEIFIRDFILPLEIAKFFLFDAEKIVSLAEANSSEQRRELSNAYSQVLGIHKYEELKEQLIGIQDDYRKKTAKPADKKDLVSNESYIKKLDIDIEHSLKQIDELNDKKDELNHESTHIQRILIRAGDRMSSEQVEELQAKEVKLKQEIEELKNKLKELFNLIPFGLTGSTMMELSKQLKNERIHAQNEYREGDVENKTDLFLDDLDRVKNKSNIMVDTKVRRFYEDKIRDLIRKHFFADITDLPPDFEQLHGFSEAQVKGLNGIIDNIKHSLKDNFKQIDQQYASVKSELERVGRQLQEAETHADDAHIADQRKKKQAIDTQLRGVDVQLEELNREVGGLKNELKSYKQKREELRKRIDVSDENKVKSDVIETEIKRLKDFILAFKKAKKKLLEENIKSGLDTLMHKKNFIDRVEVNISVSGEDVEISLYRKVDEEEQKLDKHELSMGERQMYSSALLSALVDESNIDFPVFIDSPMQKFDKEHAENIIRYFYPTVSEQVVLFPLIHKELTQDEYKVLKNRVSRSFLINNLNNDSSAFLKVEPESLIQKYDELYLASN